MSHGYFPFFSALAKPSPATDMKIIVSAIAVILASCANPGVVQTGPNTYVVSRSSAAGAFANTSMLKAEVIREANTFAAEKGKVAEGISLKEDRPLQGFPSCEYQFKLADGGGSGRAIPESVRRVQIEH